MDENPTDVQPEVEVQETTTAVPSTEESKPEAADPILEVLSDDEDKAPTETEVPEEPTQEVEKPETVETEEEKPKAKNEAQNRIRTLANENRELKRQIEEANSKVYQTQTVDELIAEGESEAMAAVKVMQQEREFEKYNQHVTEVNNTVESEAQAALNDFPMFNPDSPEYDVELATQVADLYQQTAGLQRDPNTGLLNDAKVMPYNFYKTQAAIIEARTVRGQVKAQQAMEKQLSNVDAPSSSAQPTKKVDPILEELLKD